MVGLGDLAGGDFFSTANGVSADGSIVVGYSSSTSPSWEAFIWNALDGMQSLNVLLPALGIDLTGWLLSRATGISADGLTIVGYGSHNGNAEAWMASSPTGWEMPSIREPSTVLLLAPALAGLTGFRRRSMRVCREIIVSNNERRIVR